MFCRKETLKKLKELEDAFLDNFLKVVLGQADPIEDLHTECCENHWNRYLDITSKTDNCIKRIRIICQTPCEFKEQNYYKLTGCDTETVKAIKEATKPSNAQSTGRN